MNIIRSLIALVIIGGLVLTPSVTTTAAATASVSGVVIDADSGEPVVGATVSVAGISNTSAGDGAYLISGVTAGTHDIVGSRAGFRTRNLNSYPIAAGATITQNIALTPDSIEVGSVRGYVVDALSENDLSGIRVELADG
ncbi:MAG: hypothetical protein DRP27_04395, partial [Thermotogae bacterium]